MIDLRELKPSVVKPEDERGEGFAFGLFVVCALIVTLALSWAASLIGDLRETQRRVDHLEDVCR